MKKLIYFILSFTLILFFASCKEDLPTPPPAPTGPIQLETPVIQIKDNVVSWSAVPNADSYLVHEEGKLVNNNVEFSGSHTISTTSYTIELTGKGTYRIKVQAISDDQEKFTNSSFSNIVTYVCREFEPIVLDKPILKLEENVVSWHMVPLADAYIVNINGQDLEEQMQTKYTISDTTPGDYVIKVKAISYAAIDNDELENSDYSDPVTYTISSIVQTQLTAPTITLTNNVVSWNAVEHADGYIVNLNGTDLEVQNSLTYTIDPSEDGDYEVEVRAISNDMIHFTNSQPSNKVVYHYEIPFEKIPATLFVVGDSTLASFADAYYYPRYGYGTQLFNYFDESITVNNLALSGRSSKNFISEDNYTALKNNLKAGDYLLIGFGHNDEKSDDADRFTDASKPLTDPNSFKYSLYEYYVKLALDKGATPILCTPIVRADKNNNYTAANGHVTSTGDYAQAIVELGKEKNITVINLRDLTKSKYTSLGYNEAIYYHAMTSGMKQGEEIVVNLNSVDTTHLNIFGAKYAAYLVASELKKTNNLLGKYVLDNISEPTKDKDLVVNPNYTYVDYAAPNLAGYSAPSHFSTQLAGWYGTAFGDCGGKPLSSSTGYMAKEQAGIFTVGQTATTPKGKFTSAGDGFAFAFQQIAKDKNFEITVTAKVLNTASTNQAAFGLMLRDDCYINQANGKEVITSNYLTAGFLTAQSGMNALFYRENSKLVNNTNSISTQYAVNDTAELKIIRLGQSITTTITYKDTTYTNTYYDFDLFSMDTEYMYIGMFATRGTVVEFTNVDLRITGTSLGA